MGRSVSPGNEEDAEEAEAAEVAHEEEAEGGKDEAADVCNEDSAVAAEGALLCDLLSSIVLIVKCN